MITSGRIEKPPIITMIGTDGIGKTNFAANAPNPVFIPVEDGTDEIDVSRFPEPKSMADVYSYMKYLIDNDTGHETLVIDTLDWMEKLVWKEVCGENNVRNIDDLKWQKGFKDAVPKWHLFFKGLDILRTQKNMYIVLLCHYKIKRFDPPDCEPYDRYQLNLHDSASEIVRQKSSMVLFANYKVMVRKTDVGFGKEIRRADAPKNGNDRVLYTCERPSFKAKNRHGLPPELPFEKNNSFNTLLTAIQEARET